MGKAKGNFYVGIDTDFKGWRFERVNRGKGKGHVSFGTLTVRDYEFQMDVNFKTT